MVTQAQSYVLFLCVNFLHEELSPPSHDLPLSTVIATIKSSVVHRLSSKGCSKPLEVFVVVCNRKSGGIFLDFWLIYLPVDSSCIR
ncbi:hypothetical protein L1987_42419 [Smallanthus sonchifolius]|uniref:Uncharacterized protein n=1 Tax=Smallanthus sonchifolius TaxID=185202 RepID=A0ACB9GJS9_9ASTR|nr:hypothetical protein L1987_42419 [Smallanthus sonchifolius]